MRVLAFLSGVLLVLGVGSALLLGWVFATYVLLITAAALAVCALSFSRLPQRWTSRQLAALAAVVPTAIVAGFGLGYVVRGKAFPVSHALELWVLGFAFWSTLAMASWVGRRSRG